MLRSLKRQGRSRPHPPKDAGCAPAPRMLIAVERQADDTGRLYLVWIAATKLQFIGLSSRDDGSVRLMRAD
jgi:hypothetical protein